MKFQLYKQVAPTRDNPEECVDGPVVVTKNGRPAAVLVAVSDEEELERLVLAHTPRFLALLDAAHDRIKKGGGVRQKDFWKAAEKKDRRRTMR
jgi:PHD/YefM family antitoxin component YafN of YafNO toxin-antitoxin module